MRQAAKPGSICSLYPNAKNSGITAQENLKSFVNLKLSFGEGDLSAGNES
jgi:hypothetical protein